MAASLLSTGTRAADVLSPFGRPQIRIDFTNQRDGNLAPSFTTGDRIEGTVTISAAHLISFDEVDIKLEGTQTVTVERGAVPGRSGATQTFLRLRQPMQDSSYPTPRVIEPARTYQFPFTFVVPRGLLPHVCSHSKKNAHVHHSHTLLPPSLGDPMLAQNGKTLLDDMSPDMTRVTYQIRAEVLQKPVVGPAKSLKVTQRKIRILPAVEEEPPLTVLDNDPVYRTRREKDVKRGTLRPRQGRLVAAASQPKPLQLNPPNKEPESVSTAATVHLRFDPVGDEEPPRLGTIWSKLRVATYYAAHPWEDYPNSSAVSVVGMTGDGVYYDTVPLSKMCLASAQWTKHAGNTLVRRDSLQSTSSAESITGPTACFSGDVYYTASVVVPVTLPKDKAFVPTFHSCLISRVYTLDLCVSYHTPNMNILTPTVSLKIPIQLTFGSSNTDSSGKSDEVITQEEVDAEFFSPRSVAPPAIDGADAVAPPEYSDLAEYHRSSPLPGPRPQIVPL
ncbi:Putative Arrestin (Or S-antigen), N-terminal domain protein (AFU_orthologue; AFUA_6G13380) [Aspergillus calidoustus]|uniref:Putative Arrestin (Or S-antigen), N-terminal domain protein (AFU_orthologue AFUA_6G13380) n=1 Tax=Aspergillus calidoustus TaxID=454130 RepID=A0A0U5GQI7_ASPCI|nr:Putative Arrestin (Or S-antigen), N-terminal domain protein (AFU_orthologue; AFUA_6G13380) [Aspergillus calidoustus]